LFRWFECLRLCEQVAFLLHVENYLGVKVIALGCILASVSRNIRGGEFIGSAVEMDGASRSRSAIFLVAVAAAVATATVARIGHAEGTGVTLLPGPRVRIEPESRREPEDGRAGDSVPSPTETSSKPARRLAGPVLEMVRGSDASNERSTTASVRLRNPTGAPVTVYVRRSLLSFDVLGPQGRVRCGAGGESRNPVRRAFTRLPPGRSTTLVTRLVEVCPRGTFAKQGLYWVGAELGANVDGADVGLHAFTGTLRSARPVSVRVRHTIRLFPSVPGNRTPRETPRTPAAAPSAEAPVPPPPATATPSILQLLPARPSSRTPARR
jgi:hypothetical protein